MLNLIWNHTGDNTRPTSNAILEYELFLQFQSLEVKSESESQTNNMKLNFREALTVINGGAARDRLSRGTLAARRPPRRGPVRRYKQIHLVYFSHLWFKKRWSNNYK